MKKTMKTLEFRKLPATYEQLCRIFMPRPIHDRIAYDNAMEIIEAMAGFEERFTQDQNDYFEILSDRTMDYDRKHATSTQLPLRQRLRFLLESAQWNASDLGRFLGLDATMGNKILREERLLTANHIRKLGAHFLLSADYFI